jgi:hypothetical protein
MAQFSQHGTVWQLALSHEEVGHVHDAAHVSAIIGSATGTPLGLAVAAAVVAVSSVIRTVDQIGGNNGVNVVGVGFTQLVTVTPRFISPVGLLSSFANAIQQATDLPGGVIGAGLGAGITWLAAGPALAALGGVAGYLGTVWNQPGPNPGDVHADRAAIGPWEKFTLVVLNPDRMAMLSWRGYFCAERDGGHDVHANRPHILPWENHFLVRNNDGTVSFGHNAFYFVAENGGGGGSVCNWNRTAIGSWEKFWMEYQGDGTFALKTFEKGTYVSVQ